METDTLHCIELQSVRSGEILIYRQYDRVQTLGKQSELTILSKLQNNYTQIKADRLKAYSGLVSKGVSKRMRKAIDLLISTTPTVKVEHYTRTKTISHKLSFITLTIPDLKTLTAKEAHKKLLEPMLLFLRRKHHMRSYIWKAELQKRGQLHYHLTSNVYIAHQELKDKWNELLTLNNYNSQYYRDKGHTNANSTDIKEVRKIENLGGYLTKYFCKAYQNAKSVEGKVWDCSLNLKQADYFTEQMPYSTFKILRTPELYKEIQIKHFERCIVLRPLNRKVDSMLSLESIIEKDEHYKRIWNYKRDSDKTKIHQTQLQKETATKPDNYKETVAKQNKAEQGTFSFGTYGRCIA